MIIFFNSMFSLYQVKTDSINYFNFPINFNKFIYNHFLSGLYHNLALNNHKLIENHFKLA